MKIIIIVTLFFSATVFGVSKNDEGPDNKSKTKKAAQIGIYTGYVFATKISNAHGEHGTFWGGSSDINVEGIDLNQSWALGINVRYYLTNNLGIAVDAMYSKAEFPEQQVTLQGHTINQPKSEVDFYSISVGPIIRYVSDGIWQSLNPYASAAISIPFGSASDVNLSPYGQGGYSSLSGIGFNLNLGTQYNFTPFILLLEYRFEYLSLELDHFRSFTKGLSLTKTGSYILLGGTYNF